MTKTNVIPFSRIKDINEIPSKSGYIILENHAIEKFYAKKHSHSTDLYDFRLVDQRGRSTTVFYGMLEGDNSNLDPAKANDESGKELHEELSKFAKSAPSRSRRTNKCLVERDATEHVSLIACACENGTIIGGWYNSQADKDVSLQMLAYCMFCFAALNSVAGPKDRILKEKAVDTIPDDSRFGKYPANEAETVFLAAIYNRKERMRNRARRANLS